jgi:uncharacterized protein YeeX (DUF496 family)
METQSENKNKSALLIILLLASVGLNIYQWQNKTNTVTQYDQRIDTLETEKINVEQELSEAKSEIIKYKGINASLDSAVAEYERKIADQEKAIAGIRGKERNATELNKKLKDQLAVLQTLRDEYLGRIDSLLVMNQKLKGENQQLTSTVETLSKNLETTVSTASALKSEYIRAVAFKRRGEGKYAETLIAKRAHKLDICFDVMDNKIAKTGERKVYVKITEPGGKPLGDRSAGSGTFKNGAGEEIMYATTGSISYNGSKQNLCLSYEEQQDKMFSTGTYLIEVYIDGNLSGAGSLVLR